jgi:hypothetical protein
LLARYGFWTDAREPHGVSVRFAYFAYSMSCCSVVFCGFVVHGSVYLVLGYCRLFGLRIKSFFIRKKVAVSVGFCVSSGKRGNALAAFGLKSFKVGC